MNYARIYAEFIANRRQKEPGLSGYVEVHHITPRSMGGGNEIGNLIRLTAEDHFFAHLLLAKMHGGRLWGAVFLMAAKSSWRECIRQRRMYAVARLRWAEYARGQDGLKGADNGNYNPIVYDWVHLDTRQRCSSTLHEMWLKHGGGRGAWTQAASGDKPSTLGWSLDDGSARLRSSKGVSFEFHNRDGRRFYGTQSEFCISQSVNPASASRVVRSGSVTRCGWRLSTTKDRPHNCRKEDGNPPRKGFGKMYYAEKDGVTVRGTRSDMSKALGCTPHQFSSGVGQITSGAMRTYRGWRILCQEKMI